MHTQGSPLAAPSLARLGKDGRDGPRVEHELHETRARRRREDAERHEAQVEADALELRVHEVDELDDELVLPEVVAVLEQELVRARR